MVIHVPSLYTMGIVQKFLFFSQAAMKCNVMSRERGAVSESGAVSERGAASERGTVTEIGTVLERGAVTEIGAV
jgi:hypothetical protein